MMTNHFKIATEVSLMKIFYDEDDGNDGDDNDDSDDE